MRFVPLTILAAVCATAAFVGVASRPQLEAPANVRMVARTTDSVLLDWDAVEHAPRYRLTYTMRSDAVGGTAVDLPASFGHVSGLQPNTVYRFSVAAVSADGHRLLSSLSPPARVRTRGLPQLLHVGSFNIRNPDSSGERCPNWADRKAVIARDIMSQASDVVGIQEAYDSGDRQSLLDALAAAGGTYRMTFPATVEAARDNRILYDPRRVDLLGTRYRLFKRQAHDDNVDRFVVWSLFRMRSNSRRFLFFTTHLAPGASAAATRAQWEQIVYLANKYRVVNGVRLPVVIVGDFNTSKFDRPANWMLSTMQEKGFGDVLGQTFGGYATDNQRAGKTINEWINSYNGCRRLVREYSVPRNRTGNNIDWIFVSNNLRIPLWRTVVHRVGAELTAMPSDHFLVTSTILLP